MKPLLRDLPKIPAFSAYPSINFAIVQNSNVKLACDVKEFDNYDAYDTVGKRYVVPVAGIWLFNVIMHTSSFQSGTGMYLMLFKNGAQIRLMGVHDQAASATAPAFTGSALIACAKGDVIEVYFQGSGSTGQADGANAQNTCFQGSLVSRA